MTSELLKGIAGKLAERWVTALFSPAFAFWVGVGAVWLWATQRGLVSSKGVTGAMRTWTAGVGDLPGIAQVALAVLPLLVITMSGLLLQALTFPVLRLLEGYWRAPLKAIAARRRDRWSKKADRDRGRLRALIAESHTPGDLAERGRLEASVPRVPAAPGLRMPTRLGNILRAGEARIASHYGLDPIISWPRLWLVLPDAARKEVTATRASLYLAVQAAICGAAFVPLAAWAWWAAPVGVVVAVWAYHGQALSAAARYSDIIESCYDLHRCLLYEALRWPVPSSPEDELSQGAQVTAYLRSGSTAPTPKFTADQPAKPSQADERQ